MKRTPLATPPPPAPQQHPRAPSSSDAPRQTTVRPVRVWPSLRANQPQRGPEGPRLTLVLCVGSAQRQHGLAGRAPHPELLLIPTGQPHTPQPPTTRSSWVLAVKEKTGDSGSPQSEGVGTDHALRDPQTECRDKLPVPQEFSF